MGNYSFFSKMGDSPRATNIAQGFIGEILKPGDIAVDATAGNGNDTLFLAQSVGKMGKVYSFDIQEEALAKTYARLQQAGFTDNVVLLAASHEHMGDFIDNNSCKAIMFNLGYLPGGNKNITTLPQSTVEGVRQALRLLSPGGRLSIVVYRGHPGAMEEAGALDSFISSLDGRSYWVAQITFPNRDPRAPYVILAQKKAGALK